MTKKKIDFFIKNSSSFYKDNELDNIDNKHVEIVNNAYKQFREESSRAQFNLRDWKGQTDLGIPAQFNINIIKHNGFFYTFFRYIYRNLFKREEERYLRTTILDDIAIVKLVGASSLLEENPVHLTPWVKKSYSICNTTVNIRWLRYIYLAKRIIDFEVLKYDSVWVDIGSFYGGLQGLIKKYHPKIKMVMVDFNHQLCRSYVYLSKMYPDAMHILPDHVHKYSDLNAMPKGSIMYVPVSNYQFLSNQSVDLVSNFFSLGEMKKDSFDKYINSKLFKNSKNLYLVNRVSSSPFFEKTYESNLTVLDYLKKDTFIQYFDIFPMHHYMQIKRKLFSRSFPRNTSSPYFEMVLSRRDKEGK
jgi:hypothetical protein